ncbi:MAG: hypothetical protein K2P57_00785 [Burkholderiales bacterium]|nr:hypothetical protein [Burkholderiales bacterium]
MLMVDMHDAGTTLSKLVERTLSDGLVIVTADRAFEQYGVDLIRIG